ncbi:hypothetical protein AXF42_Ash018765 [Apostasia shenzhenica]|uniref:Uncharacterized protein n=1 Tax=Apostasia shenzhenica TaxID=1088818 RepID=A0A2I0AJY6_9ASPA|nr:hypothetical protein AXF42_Ash018765 [Apostasia shenzhenica]
MGHSSQPILQTLKPKSRAHLVLGWALAQLKTLSPQLYSGWIPWLMGEIGPANSRLRFYAIAGVVLAMGFGALCGGVFGAEVAEHVKQLYKVDKHGANPRFLS